MNMSAVSAGLNLSNLDGIFGLVGDEMKVVEARRAERMESPIGSIPQVGAHLLGAGGKRLRPLLAVLASSGRRRLPPAPSRCAPTWGIDPIGLSIRSARRASTTFISSPTSPKIPSRLDRFRPADTADIFITDPTPVTTFLNIQNELKYARTITW